MHCTYCYQQNDKTLEKKLISDETLDKILSIIAQYMEANPNKTVRLGLFGGEPLLIENEKVIDKILQFCKEHKTTVHITTNGSFVLFEEIYHQSSLHQRYLSHNRQYGVKLYDAIRS